MSEPIYLNEEFKAQWKYMVEQAKSDREKYLNWIKDEISLAILLINKYDKIYDLGGLGAKLISASPNLHNQIMEGYDGPDMEHAEKEKIVEDDEIEVILEYALNIASASANTNAGVIPTEENILEIRNQLSKIKFNIGFYEMSAENPKDGNEFDHRLKIAVMEDAMHIRGNGYQSHVTEIFQETFSYHDGFLQQYYGFDSSDIFDTIRKLDLLVASKIGTAFGSSLAHQRFVEWSDVKGQEAVMNEMMQTGKHFMQQFVSENLDLYDSGNTEGPTLLPLDYIPGYNRLFWVVPKTDKEEKIFNLLSHSFGDNADFLKGKFGGFILGDSITQTKPLIKIGSKFYCFSLSLPFRNIFNITANLLQSADTIYYEQSFRGNSFANSRDNYIERKTKALFEKFLPNVEFYHSLKYNIIEDGIAKEPELDILGIGNDTIYIIEVKAGELNKKHRRGAILGLKDRLSETVNEGSYQCYRAEKFISENPNPKFKYIANAKENILEIDKSKEYRIIKISVMYEHLSSVSVNLKYLVESGVLSTDYKWTWILSLYDLMIFSDLIENEDDFKNYIDNRLGLYERDDVEFQDEIDILGFFIENKFPLPPEKENEKILMLSYRDEIENYYTKKDVGMPGVIKPIKKR
jgi:tRNA splicing endonuclease